ncbi:uncharacterized protein RAG0_06371 [Rhynchosporium agropyri]|uniref:J domain-containing protein n=1 Tax=Rhynchosporium agropyri TaxID=914238 RepID=A0A1E1KGM5_9HELO|nr:uncharacterized protein RAG0_06371 [Rhynchosporium agropyri]
MVKADLTRDYYGDLEITPGADISEIKKQFKKLALAYHPDRNPGRESEVTAKFQKIQSAHEVLIDSAERSKYDANRIRGSSRYGGGSSNVRGNPWSGAASQYPPPPKPPTARQRPPPPSTGASRYAKFATPNPSAYQSSQEGPQARKDTYEAWEKVRHQKPTPGDGSTGPGKSWKAPQPPPRGTPQSGREESNSKKHAPPHRAGPGFEEFRDPNLSGRRSQSSNTPNRRGFMPNTPGGGDEPPAPMGAYFTGRNKSTAPPEVPPRSPRQPFPREPFMSEETFNRERPQSSNPIPNPLKQFQDKTMGNEPRISTPYATHGGEKFNPFESTNINRSKSTRDSRHDLYHDGYIPRTGSDSNLNSPQRARSFAQKSSPRTARQAFTDPVNLDTSSEDSSSDGFVQMNARSSVPRTNGATANGQSAQDTGNPVNPDTNGQASRATRPSSQPQPHPTFQTGESMYECSSPANYLNFDRLRPRNFSLPTVSESPDSDEKPASRRVPSNYFREARPMTPPSGVTTTPQSLNHVEKLNGWNIEKLLNGVSSSSGKKSNSNSASADALRSGSGSQIRKTDPHYPHQRFPSWTEYRDPTSPSKISRPVKHLHTVHTFDPKRSQQYQEYLKNLKANHPLRSSSFTFNVNNETFDRTRHPSNGFSNSAENISTKFTPEDWDGKFAAGTDYFKPEMKSRTQSTSRPRGRSPVKVRSVDTTKIGQPRVESPTPVESPGGAKFSAEEWNETFKPQTFMPTTINSPSRTATTPGRKRTGPSVRPTMGTAAVVDDGETSDDKPLFTGRKNMRTVTSSPEPMDVDTPPAHNTVPQYAATPNGHLKVSAEAPDRAASTAVSQSPTDTEGLKVNFDDLKIKDLMSTLALPTPPQPPYLPSSPTGAEYERPTRTAYDDYIARYEKYMAEWDVFSSKYLLHMVARRRQNEGLKERRWTDPQATEIYRLGLKEDQAVLKSWGDMQEVHEGVVKAFVVCRERMMAREEAGNGERVKVRPRKKTH